MACLVGHPFVYISDEDDESVEQDGHVDFEIDLSAADPIKVPWLINEAKSHGIYKPFQPSRLFATAETAGLGQMWWRGRRRRA